MRQEAAPRFEVATVKPSDPSPGNSGSGFKLSGHRVFAVRENLVALITFARGLHPSQVLGAPSWADTDNFDVNGEPDEPGVPNLDQMRSMYPSCVPSRKEGTAGLCHPGWQKWSEAQAEHPRDSISGSNDERVRLRFHITADPR
jgi:hypothetical protein